MPFSDHTKHLEQCSSPSQLSAANPGQLLATKPLFWKAWHFPDGKNTRRGAEIPSPPDGFVFLDPSWPCPVPIVVPGSAVGADSDRGLSSPLSPPGSQFYPYLSNTLPWCQLRMKLEQPAFPQRLPRAGLPWDEVLALSLGILRSYL